MTPCPVHSRTQARNPQDSNIKTKNNSSLREMPKNKNTHARKSHSKRITKKTQRNEELKASRLKEAPAEEGAPAEEEVQAKGRT